MIHIQDGIKHIFPKDFIQIYGKEKIQLIDIREPYELVQLPFAHAINFPLQYLLSKESALLDKQQMYYIICHHGQRSYVVTEILTNKGYNVVNVVGGIDLVNRFDTLKR